MPMHVASGAYCHHDAAAFTGLAGPSLNTVTLSYQRTSSRHTVPPTALIVRIRM